MRERLMIAVTFDPQRGYGTAGEAPPLAALSLSGEHTQRAVAVFGSSASGGCVTRFRSYAAAAQASRRRLQSEALEGPHP